MPPEFWANGANVEGGAELDAEVRVGGGADGRRDTIGMAVEELRAAEYGPLLVPACSDLLVLLDDDRAVRYVSPSVARLLGRSAGEVVGQDLSGLVHPDDWEAVAERLAGSAGELDWGDVIECRMRHANGSWRVMEMYSRSLERDRDVVSGSVSTLRDITERKEYERALEWSGRHERLLAHVPSPVLVLSRDGEILYANRTAVGVLEAGSLENLLGASLLELAAPAHRAALRRALRRACRDDAGADVQVSLSPSGDHPVDLDVRLLATSWEGYQAVVGIAHDVSGWTSTQAELQRRALFDDLTGLPNRALLRDRLEHALARARRRGHQPMVVFLDLDRFKTVNDSLGHHVGDQLLKEVAARLQAVVRPQDTVARFGGDEFVVLIEEAGGPEHALTIARRVADALVEEVDLYGRSIPVKASIGVAGAAEVVGGGPDDIVQAADTAMYRAKSRGGGLEFYTPALQQEALRRLELESDLHRVLLAGELELAFQPIVSLDRRQVVGMEALARWTHPVHGEVPPDVFVALAEESGLIGDLGRLVLQRTYEQAMAWRREGLVSRSFGVHVNVSARQLTDDSLVAQVRALIATGDGVALLLELTEGVLMAEDPGTEAALRQLRDLGVGIAIDDFGTGYSSLAYLSSLPVDALKLDRRFVGRLDDERSARVAGAVVALGQALDVGVVAEGVETADEERALRRLGVERAQGFRYGRPVSSTAFAQMLRGDAAGT